MLYFSELQGMSIYTTDNVRLGTLKDMIFESSQTPQISKFVIESKKKLCVISFKLIRTAEHKIIINSSYTNAEYAENELYIGQNLLDKQIIDLVGNKMV